VTMSLFPEAICYPPCVCVCVRTTSAHCSPFLCNIVLLNYSGYDRCECILFYVLSKFTSLLLEEDKCKLFCKMGKR
jgi:hypothetical protein